MNQLIFLGYPKCSTSRKAKKWLDEQGAIYQDRDIVTDNPTSEELSDWHARSGLPIRRLFNTSGMLYREQGVKDKLDQGMTDADAFTLLATDGKMVKRPILIGEDFVLFGFKEDQWEDALSSIDGRVR